MSAEQINQHLDARYARYEVQGIERELRSWGKWIEDHADYEGHPSRSVSCTLEAHGGNTPGHRILCLDMPTHIYATHSRVLRLPVHEQEAVFIWYVVRLRVDGTVWPYAEKCAVAGISADALRKRVSRARLRICGLPIPDEGRHDIAPAVTSGV